MRVIKTTVKNGMLCPEDMIGLNEGQTVDACVYDNGSPDELRSVVEHYVKEFHAKGHKAQQFVPGKGKVHYAGRVYDQEELVNLVNSSLDFWLTAGRYAGTLEEQFKNFFGAEAFYLVNSGSSANLVLISSLSSAKIDNPLASGDEIITPAVTFPTTLSPILQSGFVPVFVDCEVGTYNIDPRQLEAAIGPKTRAIFLPHTLGNPIHLDLIAEIARKHKLFLLEDSCDALGATWDGKLVGTFGDMASLSFYPAHHMTTGEGGGVVVNNPMFASVALSIRDWGRDCWCETGKSNSCSKRFSGQYGKLPYGYDHKYVYSHLGYNLKLTDMQAAIGLAQFKKLPGFIEARRNNFKFYYDRFKAIEDKIVLPRWESKANPSWFGFPITVRGGLDTKKLIEKIEKAGIETRKIFSGNILKQPGFMDIRHRVSGALKNTDEVMTSSFFIGVYPGLTAEMKEYVADTLLSIFKGA